MIDVMLNPRGRVALPSINDLINDEEHSFHVVQ